ERNYVTRPANYECAGPRHACLRASALRAAARSLAGERASWSAAGSEAPRRFGWCGGVVHELGISTAVGRRSKAPSPLRSAGALLQNLAGDRSVGWPRTLKPGCY